MHCLDANVWVYYLDAGLPEHDRVSDAVTAVLESEPLLTPAVVQMEVVHYLTNQLSDSEPAVRRFLNLEGQTVASLVPEDVERAAALLHEHPHHGIGGRDAAILAATDRYGATDLWTHDRDLVDAAERLTDLDVTDPVDADVGTG